MTIRQRAFGAIVLIFLIGSALLYFASTLLVQAQFGKIETADVQKDTSRAVDALNNRVDDLSTKLSDWSNWDDTYRFIADHNQAYIDSNLQNGSLANLGVTYMLFFRADHTLAQAKGISSYGEDLAVSKQLLSYFGPSSKLLADSVGEIHKGFIRADDQTLYFVARPILTSNAGGPARGTLVFVETFAPDDAKQIANLTHLTVEFYASNGNVPADVTQVRSELSATHPIAQTLSSSHIAGYELLNDIQGRPIIIARVVAARDAFTQAQHSLTYFLVAIAVVTLLSILLAIYITNQVLARDQVIRLKDEFFSIASHELRTPLTAIHSNARLLQTYYSDKNDQNFGELTNDVADSSTRLIRLVNNFLDAARFEKGKVPLKPEPLALADVADAVVRELQSLAKDKSIYIRSEVKPALPQVYADRDRVMQIIYNLVGNAAKFTEKGGVTISAEPVGAMLKVYVADTGRGIPPEGQKMLFRKFRQVKAADSKTGSGLGLYIAKMLVELMGGKVSLERSEEGKGTTLGFTLPLATEQAKKL